MRWENVLDPDLNKGKWTQDEDLWLQFWMFEEMKAGRITELGTGWSIIAEHLPRRNAKQCRERWYANLDPMVKKGDWTPAEDAILLNSREARTMGWSSVARLLPGRTGSYACMRVNSEIPIHACSVWLGLGSGLGFLLVGRLFLLYADDLPPRLVIRVLYKTTWSRRGSTAWSAAGCGMMRRTELSSGSTTSMGQIGPALPAR
jgi:hypothetical protein